MREIVRNFKTKCEKLYETTARFVFVLAFNYLCSMTKKDNQLINREVIQSFIISTARYDFTADEKRVLTRIISNLQPMLEGKQLRGKVERDLWDNVRITAPIADYLNENKSYTRARDALFALNEKKFIYRDDEVEEVIRIVEMPRVYRRGMIQYTLNPKIVDCFLNFSKGYSKYQLAISLSFSSVYAMRIYELISGQRDPITFRIDHLKEMFDIADKYPRNRDFMIYVIDAAQKELNDKSPYTFDYKVNKKGRAFHSITFIPIYQADKDDLGVQEADLKRRVNSSWFVGKELRDYLKNTCGFSEREIKNNISLLRDVEARYGVAILDKIREIWSRARVRSNSPKAYVIGALKKLLINGEK